MGATTNLFPSAILGSASAGEGVTADNVSPMNLIYLRRIGYGVRDAGFLFDAPDKTAGGPPTGQKSRDESWEILEALTNM
jgi:hypothetical protein